jgi:hypothetical protein
MGPICAEDDALGVLLRWKKERHHSGHSYSTIWHTDEDFLRQRAGAGHEDGGSQALFSGGKVGFSNLRKCYNFAGSP